MPKVNTACEWPGQPGLKTQSARPQSSTATQPHSQGVLGPLQVTWSALDVCQPRPCGPGGTGSSMCRTGSGS